MKTKLTEPPTRAQLIAMLATLRGSLSGLIGQLKAGGHLDTPGELADDVEDCKEILRLTGGFPGTPEDFREHTDGGETFDMTWRFGEESHYAKKETQ